MARINGCKTRIEQAKDAIAEELDKLAEIYEEQIRIGEKLPYTDMLLRQLSESKCTLASLVEDYKNYAADDEEGLLEHEDIQYMLSLKQVLQMRGCPVPPSLADDDDDEEVA
jgi:ferric iron reductase protein FhuF